MRYVLVLLVLALCLTIPTAQTPFPPKPTPNPTTTPDNGGPIGSETAVPPYHGGPLVHRVYLAYITVPPSALHDRGLQVSAVTRLSLSARNEI